MELGDSLDVLAGEDADWDTPSGKGSFLLCPSPYHIIINESFSVPIIT